MKLRAKVKKNKKGESMGGKLTSRKFWLCVAAFLASIATSISGLVTDNQIIAIIGTICGILSAAIYNFCEAWVDSRGYPLPQNEVERIGFAVPDKPDKKEG
jgi:hypothetical protein